MKLRQVPTSLRDDPLSRPRNGPARALGTRIYHREPEWAGRRAVLALGIRWAAQWFRDPTSRLPKVLVAPGDGTGSTKGKTWLRTKSL